MSARAIAVLVFSTAGLASCAVGPRYSPPAVSMPAGFLEAPAAANTERPPLEQWWTRFWDPVLDDLVARAIADNLDLKVASARIREARAARGSAASAALPQGKVYGQDVGGARSNAVPPFNVAGGSGSLFGSRTQNIFEAGFDAFWELDVFGGVRRDVEAAVAQVQVAEEERRDVLVTLVAEVARSYAELRGRQSQLEILARTIQSQQETFDLARARFDAGLGTSLDVNRAEGLLQATASRQPELERGVRQSIYRIGVLLGQHPAALASALEIPKAIPPQPPSLPEALPSELLSRRPDLRRAERELAAATARIGVAKADLFPRFSITGSFGRRSDGIGDLGSNASSFGFLIPGVRWPILSGGRIRANLRVQDARQEQALHQYQKAILTAVEEVENAMSALTREQWRLELLRAAAGANRRALDLATDRYTSGLENFLSVLDTERALYASEDGVAQAESNRMLALIAVYKALGGGWEVYE